MFSFCLKLKSAVNFGKVEEGTRRWRRPMYFGSLRRELFAVKKFREMLLTGEKILILPQQTQKRG